MPPLDPDPDGLPLPAAAVTFSPRKPSARLKSLWTRMRHELGPGSLASDSFPTSETLESASTASWVPGRAVAPSRDEIAVEASDAPVSAVVVENLASPARWILDARRDANNLDTSSEAAETTGRREPTDTRGGSDGRASSVRDFSAGSSWAPIRVIGSFVKCSAWPLIMDFFATKYPDHEIERTFQKELWFTQKSTHVVGAAFVLLTFLLQIGLQKGTMSQWNRIGTWVIGPIISTPLIIMALFNVPLKKQWYFQALVWFCIWVGSCGFLIDLYMCNYFEEGGMPDLCRGRDWLGAFFYSTALPVVGLFALGQKRILHLAGVVVWVILSFVLVVPQKSDFLRDMLPWILFQLFVLFFHYMRENSERRMFTLRMELKVQFRAKQKAQINERKTQDAKRRFTNYVFHEVRVPLHTALLAVQNLKAANVPNVFDKNSELSVEYSALESSLSMMSTVLNDVLDFSRMEKGRFSSVSLPFSFHRMIQSILGPLRLDTTARGLDLLTTLDPRIDEVAVRAMRPPGSEISFEEGDGILMGDEIRIRQVINNLASYESFLFNNLGCIMLKHLPGSNACKFTNKGGRVSLSTKLVFPNVGAEPRRSPSADSTEKDTAFGLERPVETDCVIVRIEVSDSGVGISPADLKHGALFSAYHQNQQTLLQGGKGTGLGLSLVRQIISLSGGRLGVESQANKGSTFWCELPLSTLSPETVDAGLDIQLRRGRLAMSSALATPNTYTEQSDYGFGTPPLHGSQDETTADLEMVAIASRERVFTLSIPPLALVSTATPPTSLPGTPVLLPSKVAKLTMQFAGGPLRVLVVDDDSLTRRLMSRMVSRLGCNVETAENGAIALSMILAPLPGGSTPAHNFDIICLDNQMPVLTGLQVVARLKALERTDFIVGITANAELQDQQEYIEAGASVVLTKPVKESDLRRLLLRADEKRAARPASP